jgi:hypothetical protein
MARKPIVEPSTRSQAFLSGQRPLLMSDLTSEEQSAAIGAVSKHTENIRGQLDTLSSEKNLSHKSPMVRQKAKRSKKALDEGAVDKPYSHEDAVRGHMEHFKNAALNPREGEAIHGVDFYSQNADPIHKIIQSHSVDPVTAFGATAKLSYKNRPENEKRSLSALLGAHDRGSVTYTPELVDKVHSVIDGSHRIPQEDIGKTVPYSHVHPEVASALTDPKIRDDVKHGLKNVDLDEIGFGGQRKNISAAHAVLQTGASLDPYNAPKFASYTLSHAEAPRVGSPEHQEYNMRAANIHDVLTGKVSSGQHMIDFYGLRSSNEGHLSNVAPTPIDMHHRRIAYAQPHGAPYAASGDLNMSAKGPVAQGDKKITATGIEHAVLQDSVHEAAKRIQTENNLHFTVPSRMMNEASWASTREMTGDDPNPAKKERAKAHPEALKEEKTRTANFSKQMELPF